LFCRFLRVIETLNRNGKAWSGKNLAVFSSLQESLKRYINIPHYHYYEYLPFSLLL